MLELEAAQARILDFIQPLNSLLLPLAEAEGRFLSSTARAASSLPPFDNSAMDGYAVRAADVATATADQPVQLRCVATLAAGEPVQTGIGPGHCLRVFTGSVLPPGADAVVMQEDTRNAGELVAVLDPVKPWENVRFAGEDARAGSPVGEPGQRLTPARLALLAAAGLKTVEVHRPPAAAVLSTGNELVEGGDRLQPGQIHESNRLMLAGLIRQAGGQPQIHPLVRDSLADTAGALESAFAQCDVVITSGGVSVGEHDHVKAALTSLGGELEFWRVALKPGKPFAFGRLGGKLLFGLPGNPVSAFVTFLLLVRPALLRLQGAMQTDLPRHPAILSEPMSNRGDRRHFMRVQIDSKGLVRSAGTQASHFLSSLASAEGLLPMPPQTVWPAGTSVEVLRW